MIDFDAEYEALQTKANDLNISITAFSTVLALIRSAYSLGKAEAIETCRQHLGEADALIEISYKSAVKNIHA